MYAYLSPVRTRNRHCGKCKTPLIKGKICLYIKGYGSKMNLCLTCVEDFAFLMRYDFFKFADIIKKKIPPVTKLED